MCYPLPRIGSHSLPIPIHRFSDVLSSARGIAGPGRTPRPRRDREQPLPGCWRVVGRRLRALCGVSEYSTTTPFRGVRSPESGFTGFLQRPDPYCLAIRPTLGPELRADRATRHGPFPGFPGSRPPPPRPRAPSGGPRRNFAEPDPRRGAGSRGLVPLTWKRHPAAVRAWRLPRVIFSPPVASTSTAPGL